MRKLDLILTGTGRCATAFYARFLTSAGMNCGHERFFGPWDYEHALWRLDHWMGTWAESSWLAAPHLSSDALADAFVVHLVRHPKSVIESWLRVSPETTAQYAEYRYKQLPFSRAIVDPITQAAHWYIQWNKLIERKLQGRDYLRFNVEREPVELLDELEQRDFTFSRNGELFDNRKLNHKAGVKVNVSLADITDPALCDELEQMSQAYGYAWPEYDESMTGASQTNNTDNTIVIQSLQPTVKAVITTLDNLENLYESVTVLRAEPLDQIIVVNNGSRDGTREWLDKQDDIIAIHRENLGAGPGRNAGIDAAEPYDFVMLLDGGIRPLLGGTSRMLDYLLATPDADVVGVEIPDFSTDRDTAWRRWPYPITKTYPNTRLSHTAYCLARSEAFDGIRFCEDGPFSMPGWGADDDELAFQWNEAGINIHVVTGVHPYRRHNSSAARLLRETGVTRTDYGSVYEQRVVWLQHHWPQHQPGLQWGEPWLTVIVEAREVDETAKIIKAAHDHLRKRRFKKPWTWYSNPYSIVAWCPDGNGAFLDWAEPRYLRQHHGTATVIDGEILRRTPQNEETWTGDFRIWTGEDWRGAVRPGAFLYNLVSNRGELDKLLTTYERAHPPKLTRLEVPQARPANKGFPSQLQFESWGDE